MGLDESVGVGVGLCARLRMWEDVGVGGVGMCAMLEVLV